MYSLDTNARDRFVIFLTTSETSIDCRQGFKLVRVLEDLVK